MAQVRVRFAPSPTGFFHFGSASTALFNWLYARLAVTDTQVGPSITCIFRVLGRERVSERLMKIHSHN